MLTLSLMPISLAVVRLSSLSSIPLWAIEGDIFFSITKTQDELSVVCVEDKVRQDVRMEKGWRCLKVEGPLDFNSVLLGAIELERVYYDKEGKSSKSCSSFVSIL